MSGALLFLACGGSTSTPSSRKNTNSPTLTSEAEASLLTDAQIKALEISAPLLEKYSINDLKKIRDNRLNQNVVEIQDLEIYKAINNTLCRRIAQLRNECSVATLIMPAAQSVSLNCTDEGPEAASVSQSDIKIKFEAKSSLAPGEFYLEAEGLYESSSFKSGEEKVITFALRQGRTSSQTSPSFKDLSALLIRNKDPNAILPSPNILHIVIRVGDKIIFDGFPLVGDSSSGNKQYQLPMNQILDLSNSPACKPDMAEINRVTDETRNNIQSQYASKEPVRKRSGSSKEELINEIIQYRDEIEQRFPALTAERDRAPKLKSELSKDNLVGCQETQPINEIKFEITGQKETNPYQIGRFDEPLTGTPNGGTIKIEMGDGIVFSKDAVTLMGHPGVFIDTLPNTLVSGVKYLKISKLGVSYESIRHVSTQLVFFNKTEFDVYENDIFSIQGIKVFINSTQVYENLELDLKLASNKVPGSVLSWSAPTFRSQELWQKFMLRTDCDQK